MTIIAFDGTAMAGDRAMWNGSVCVPTTKVFRVPKSGVSLLRAPLLVGCAGTAWWGVRVMRWLEEGGDPPQFPDDEKGKSVALVVDRRRRMFQFSSEGLLSPVRVEGRRTAFGATVGVIGAMCAMESGASARQAVLLVAKYTDVAGLGVDVVRF